MQEKLERAKTKGLDALRTFLHVYETDYNLIPISSKTLSAVCYCSCKMVTEFFKLQQ